MREVRESLLADETVRWAQKEIAHRLTSPKADSTDAKRQLAEVDKELQRIADAIAQVGLSPTLQTKLGELETRREAQGKRSAGHQ